MLESTIEIKSQTVEVMKEQITDLKTRVDKVEQYSMRPSLRINGLIAPNGNETNADVLKIVKDISEDLGVKLNDDDIFRAHRVGKPYAETTKQGTPTGKKLQSVIVRFRSWSKRCDFYKARPTYKKKQEAKATDEDSYASTTAKKTLKKEKKEHSNLQFNRTRPIKIHARTVSKGPK